MNLWSFAFAAFFWACAALVLFPCAFLIIKLFKVVTNHDGK